LPSLRRENVQLPTLPPSLRSVNSGCSYFITSKLARARNCSGSRGFTRGRQRRPYLGSSPVLLEREFEISSRSQQAAPGLSAGRVACVARDRSTPARMPATRELLLQTDPHFTHVVVGISRYSPIDRNGPARGRGISNADR
jgi:hypothetical protein